MTAFNTSFRARDTFTASGQRMLVLALLVLPWVQPWAPSPVSNTVPLLLSWGCLAVLLAWGRLPCALELAQGWALAALLSASMGLVQYFGHAAGLGGWVHVPAYLGDAVANLRQRNQLATHLGMGMVAVLWWQRQGLHRGHALWMLALLAWADAATASRTGLLQVLLLPALLALWLWTAQRHPHHEADPLAAIQSKPWRRRDASCAPGWPLALWTVSMYLLASLALPHLLTWHTGAAVSSAVTRIGEMNGCGSRSVLWSNVLHLIGQKPWTGWGWGELKYAHYMADYPGERFCDILGNAHNLPLHLAVELGIPFATLACLTLLALLWRARPWRLQTPADALGWGVLAMIGLHSLLEYPLWYGPYQLSVVAAVLLLWPQARAVLWRQVAALGLLGAGLLLALSLIGLDYQRMRQIYLPPAQRWTIWQADPWAAARRSVLFADTVAFADYTSHPEALTPEQSLAQGLALLHYSPEPRIIERVIEAADRLGQHELAEQHRQRLARAFAGQDRASKP